MFDFIKASLRIKILLSVSVVLILLVTAGAAYVYHYCSVDLEDRITAHAVHLTTLGAKGLEQAIHTALTNRVFSETDFFDNYYEPIPGVEQPRYHTRYDLYINQHLADFQKFFLKDRHVLYVQAMDRNGYVPFHVSRFHQPAADQKPGKGELNRAKRIFNDPHSVSACRNQKEVLIQQYDYLPQVEVWAVSAPVFLNNRHWGCFQVGYQARAQENAKWNLFRLLFGVSLLVTSIFIGLSYLVLRRLIGPLTEFAAITTDLADGDVEHVIRTKRTDEIGQIAEALERLRVSLKAAMERLMRSSNGFNSSSRR